MICNQCQQDRSEKDFLCFDVCYKCVLKNKSILVKKSPPQVKQCKICKNSLPNEKLIYWKSCYCGDECAKKGKGSYNKNYWIHSLNISKVQKGLRYGKPK